MNPVGRNVPVGETIAQLIAQAPEPRIDSISPVDVKDAGFETGPFENLLN